MPVLSVSNRSQLSIKLEGAYPTNFGVLQGGNGTLMNMLSESLDFTVKTESSKAIRADRQVADIVQVGASAQGGFAFEHTFKEYDPLITGITQKAFTPYGTAGVSTTLPSITSIVTASNITTITFSAATSGADILTALLRGQWIGFKPPAAATQAVKDYLAGRAFRVSQVTTPTSTVLVLDASTPMNTAIVGASMVALSVISSSWTGTCLVAETPVMSSYSIEVQHADINQFRQYLGMIPSKMDLKLAVNAIVTGGFEFMGKGFSLVGATGMGTSVAAQTYTPANATKGVFDIFENGASVTATTYIKSADMTIDGNLRAQEAVGVFGNAGIAPGTMNIMGKLEVYFADATMYSKLLNNTASSLSIPILDVDGNGYVYHYPRIKYKAAKVAVGGLDQDNMLSMDWQALPDITVGSPTLGRTVIIYRVGAG